MSTSPLSEPRPSVIMMGSSGAVGGQVARALVAQDALTKLTLLGRRPTEGVSGAQVIQETIDVLEPASYAKHLSGHDCALCTLGIGQPSQVSKEHFTRIDKDAVLDFARGCKEAGVSHFQLLSSVGASASSSSFYLRTKGELENELRALNFTRLSLFRPSMILTPTNRYGISQALTLAVWPKLRPVLIGPLRKLRGIRVAQLGEAMASNVFTTGAGAEVLEWDDFRALAGTTR